MSQKYTKEGQAAFLKKVSTSLNKTLDELDAMIAAELANLTEEQRQEILSEIARNNGEQ